MPVFYAFGLDFEIYCFLYRDGSSPESSSELDSGISVNVNYEDPTRWKRGDSNRGSTSPDEDKGKKCCNIDCSDAFDGIIVTIAFYKHERDNTATK